MISIRIDGQEREGIDEGWIARVIGESRRAGNEPCVRIAIKTGGAVLSLQAGSCGPGGGGGRAPNPREREILEIWGGYRRIQSAGYPVGQLIQCLKRVERAL